MSEPTEIQELAAFGATESSVVALASLDYRHLDYLDLPRLPEHLPRVRAVVEMGGRSILYVVRGPLAEPDLSIVRQLLAQRGAADHLGILEPGVLSVVPLLSRSTRRQPSVEQWRADTESARGRLPGLAFGLGRDDSALGTANRLHDRLVDLLSATTTSVVMAGVRRPEDALSLVGRALFFRGPSGFQVGRT